MKKIVVCLFLFSLLAFPVSSLQITPSDINIEIKEGNYKLVTLHFYNELNNSVNVSLSSPLPISFSDTFFQLSKNQSKNIQLYILGETTTSGFILVSYDNTSVFIPIHINITKEVIETGNITFFPSIPTAGEYFVISFPSPINQTGFLWLNKEIIPIDIKNGFTILKVNKTQYGEAKLWLYGKGFIASFNIECGIEGDAVINIPESVTIGEIAEISITIGDTPLNNLDVVLIDPDGLTYSFETDRDGKIYPVMNKIGEWSVKTSFKNKQIVKKTNVVYKPLSLSINKNTIKLGETVTITSQEKNIEYIVKKDGVTRYQTTVTDGTLEYSPSSSGSYTVFAKTNEKQGSIKFSVKRVTTIKIFNENNMQTSVLKQGKNYIIKVTDETGNIVSDYNEINIEPIYTEFIEAGLEPIITTISLNNGVGFWSPRNSGNYSLSIPDLDNNIGCSAIISIEKTLNQNTDLSIVFYVIAVVIIAIIIFVILYLYKHGLLPNLPKRKKIPDKLL